MGDNSIDCIVCDPPYFLNFMGKEFDKFKDNIAKNPIFWKEALRICKPGSFLLASGSPRTHHHLAMAIENAGWEITDCIMHIFGSGFPKGKSQLKPAYEPWILARKKAHKVRHLNIDDCRIPTKPRETHLNGNYTGINKIYGKIGEGFQGKGATERWPSNLILGDEEVEKMLDEQSGILSKGHAPKFSKSNPFGGINNQKHDEIFYEKGGASRFFYCAKASRSERGEGNGHPTVKPQKLMKYLIKLVMPKHEGAVLLDPFLGSGSTLVACKSLGVDAIGIEMNEEYCEIARKRVENVNVKPLYME